MRNGGFAIYEHPADIGISAHGNNYAEACANAARGLFSLIVDLPSVECREIKEVHVEGDDREQVLVRWLSELLFLYDAEKFVMADVDVRVAQRNALAGTLKGERLDVAKHAPKLDVKAITYHQLEIVDEKDGSVAIQFVVDI